jgi:glucosamine--fructose-6-phosphate aminotransferase (isomerizing)
LHKRGAWVHAIVNRRNSPLVRKADSHSFTSNGRDVEMSVASTKAFYSQVTAGALLALRLAGELGTLSGRQILDDLAELETLPARIEEVLALRGEIAAHAGRYAPSCLSWAVVGSGTNRIAAEEIRIKLSELCYKSIPCDITEDKKHIDLSTEPLTIVVANDLPEMVVQDTVKEVTIFKAHNGKPLVLCERGENRFDEIADEVIKLPPIGAGLAFVVATTAGHLWGIEAAKAIDREAEPFLAVRSLLGEALQDPSRWDLDALRRQLHRALAAAADGRMDATLPAGKIATVARYLLWLEAQPGSLTLGEARLVDALTIINRILEDLRRPIDTIRHQAKTVTVGISRPEPPTATGSPDVGRAGGRA